MTPPPPAGNNSCTANTRGDVAIHRHLKTAGTWPANLHMNRAVRVNRLPPLGRDKERGTMEW